MAALVTFYTVRLASERDRARLEADKSARMSELLASFLTGADPYRHARPRADRPQHPRCRRRARAEGAGGSTRAEGRDAERDRPGVPAARPARHGAAAARRGPGDRPAARMARPRRAWRSRSTSSGSCSASAAMPRAPCRCSRRPWRCAGGMLGNKDKDVAVTLVELGRAFEESGRERSRRAALPRSAGHQTRDLRRAASRNLDQQGGPCADSVAARRPDRRRTALPRGSRHQPPGARRRPSQRRRRLEQPRVAAARQGRLRRGGADVSQGAGDPAQALRRPAPEPRQQHREPVVRA